jgi:hypothetical protein
MTYSMPSYDVLTPLKLQPLGRDLAGVGDVGDGALHAYDGSGMRGVGNSGILAVGEGDVTLPTNDNSHADGVSDGDGTARSLARVMSWPLAASTAVSRSMRVAAATRDPMVTGCKPTRAVLLLWGLT